MGLSRFAVSRRRLASPSGVRSYSDASSPTLSAIGSAYSEMRLSVVVPGMSCYLGRSQV